MAKDNGFHYNGPANVIEADDLGLLAEALGEMVAQCDHRHVITANRAQYHRVIALVDEHGWTRDLAVTLSNPPTELNHLVVIPRPPGLAVASPGRHRYGTRRCSHCAIRLPWYALPGVELCRDCRPMPRDQKLSDGRVIRAGAPGPGRAFPRGSRWDASPLPTEGPADAS